MKVRDEINRYTTGENQVILLWLFDRYHMQSQWNFVARCSFERYGQYSYQVNRIWAPSEEGKILYYNSQGVIYHGTAQN